MRIRIEKTIFCSTRALLPTFLFCVEICDRGKTGLICNFPELRSTVSILVLGASVSDVWGPSWHQCFFKVHRFI